MFPNDLGLFYTGSGNLKVYRDVIRPERVAELLILRADMPRSLHASMNKVVSNLALLANEQSGDTERLAGKLCAELKYQTSRTYFQNITQPID